MPESLCSDRNRKNTNFCYQKLISRELYPLTIYPASCHPKGLNFTPRSLNWLPEDQNRPTVVKHWIKEAQSRLLEAINLTENRLPDTNIYSLMSKLISKRPKPILKAQSRLIYAQNRSQRLKIDPQSPINRLPKAQKLTHWCRKRLDDDQNQIPETENRLWKAQNRLVKVNISIINWGWSEKFSTLRKTFSKERYL